MESRSACAEIDMITQGVGKSAGGGAHRYQTFRMQNSKGERLHEWGHSGGTLRYILFNVHIP